MDIKKTVVITGATGLIGRKLSERLIRRGDDVIVFTRNTLHARAVVQGALDYVEWDPKSAEDYSHHFEKADAVVHLAGANVAGKKWTEEYKQEILESRTKSTHSLVDALGQLKNRPGGFICSSAIGYYGSRGDEKLTEDSAAGEGFLPDVCVQWEEEAAKAAALGVRHVSIRTGIVLSTEDGALAKMIPPFRFFVGGPLGSGEQWFSWIHIDDVVGMYLFAIDNSFIKGVMNATAPNPSTMKDFAKMLGSVMHRPSLFKVPKFVLKLIMGEGADFVTASQRCLPENTQKMGYKFTFPELEEALKDLVQKA